MERNFVRNQRSYTNLVTQAEFAAQRLPSLFNAEKENLGAHGFKRSSRVWNICHMRAGDKEKGLILTKRISD